MDVIPLTDKTITFTEVNDLYRVLLTVHWTHTVKSGQDEDDV